MALTMSAYAFGSVIGLLLVTVVIGLLVLQTGWKHGQDALGWGGLFACLAGGLVLGILLSGPLALLFAWLIRRRAAKPDQTVAPAWPAAGPERVSQ
jgi:hypothetical protein